MKEIVKASLAGIGFVFDKDAFEVLEAYLAKLSESYRSNPDGDEIIADIEARMVELILSRQDTETVVVKGTVDGIIEQLGAPEESASSEPLRPEPQAESFPRRLYRDLDGKKIGGVCNGLARYFDVDPSLVRISLAIPLVLLIILSSLGFYSFNGFLGSLIGVIFLLYFIIWIAVPAAKTPRQKLEMQGRRITASDIEREMAGSAAVRDRGSESQESVFARLFTLIGRLLLFFVKLFILFLGFIFAVSALAIIVAIFGLLLGKAWVMNGFAAEDITFALGSMGIPAAGFAAMVLGLIAIPFIMLVYQMVRLTLGGKNNRTLMWILGGCWILLALFTTVTVVANSEEVFHNWRGVRIEFNGPGRITTGTEEGWEIYERNVREFRDSLEKASGGVADEFEVPETVSEDVTGISAPGPEEADSQQ